jgi:hypothetical protein
MAKFRRQELIRVILRALPIVSHVTGHWMDGLPEDLRETAHQVEGEMIEALDAEAGRNGPVIGRR